MTPLKFDELISAWRELLPEVNTGLKAWGKSPALPQDKPFISRFHEMVEQMATTYLQASPEQCAEVRALIRQFEGVWWCLRLPVRKPEGEREFKLELAVLSMRDHHKDTRDELVTLSGLLRVAHEAGIRVATALKEVAALSSNDDRYGMGSMREILEHYDATTKN